MVEDFFCVGVFFLWVCLLIVEEAETNKVAYRHVDDFLRLCVFFSGFVWPRLRRRKQTKLPTGMFMISRVCAFFSVVAVCCGGGCANKQNCLPEC